MVGQNNLRAVRDEKVAIHFHTGSAQGSNFLQEGQRINHHAVADDAGALGPQNAARHELQDELFPIDDDGVSGVMAAGVASDHRKGLSEYVDNLALALVAPLRSYNDRSPASARLTSSQFKLHLEFCAAANRGPPQGRTHLPRRCCWIDWKTGKIGGTWCVRSSIPNQAVEEQTSFLTNKALQDSPR